VIGILALGGGPFGSLRGGNDLSGPPGDNGVERASSEILGRTYGVKSGGELFGDSSAVGAVIRSLGAWLIAG